MIFALISGSSSAGWSFTVTGVLLAQMIPVVGLSIDGTLQWFRRMDSRKALRALVELVEDGTIAKPLLNRRDRKRAGKLRS